VVGVGLAAEGGKWAVTTGSDLRNRAHMVQVFG
jgi:hypothetical protein